LVSYSTEEFLPLSETASRNACVRACRQRCSDSTVIAARLPACSRRVVHAVPGRFVPVGHRASCLNIYYRFIAGWTERMHEQLRPRRHALTHRQTQCCNSNSPVRIRALSPVYRALLLARRHDLFILWQTISAIERRLHFELAIVNKVGDGRLHCGAVWLRSVDN